MNFQEALEKRVELQHAIAVYEEVLDHLDDFTRSDIRTAGSVLEVDDCPERTVRPSVIETVRTEIEQLLSKVQSNLDTINKMKVT